jgi:hypothetical protein
VPLQTKRLQEVTANPTKDQVKLVLRAIGDMMHYSQRVPLQPHAMPLYQALERFLVQTKSNKSFRSFRNAALPVVTKLLCLLGSDFLSVADEFYGSYVAHLKWCGLDSHCSQLDGIDLLVCWPIRWCWENSFKRLHTRTKEARASCAAPRCNDEMNYFKSTCPKSCRTCRPDSCQRRTRRYVPANTSDRHLRRRH